MAPSPSILGGGNFKNLIDLVFPIGICIYLGTDVNPNDLYPDTTWELIKGRFIIGYDDEDTQFQTINDTGGEKAHTLKIEEMPSHRHKEDSSGYHDVNSSKFINDNGTMRWLNTENYNKTAFYTSNVGGSQAHNNMPPYIVKYIWERIA